MKAHNRQPIADVKKSSDVNKSSDATPSKSSPDDHSHAQKGQSGNIMESTAGETTDDTGITAK